MSVTGSGSDNIDTATGVLDLSVNGQTLNPTIIYSYTALYDAVGNVTQYQDSVMGTWNFAYDTLNRLQTAVPGANAPAAYAGQSLCFAYDAFGNRTAESWQSTACPAQESSVTPSATYNANNQVTWTTVNSAVGGFQYDAAGDVMNDNLNTYLYDPEGRVCAVENQGVGGTIMTGYLYDAEGNRIAKGTITTMSCDPAVSGFQLTETYVIGQGGQELSQLSTSGSTTAWQRTNVYGAGRQLATYDLVNGNPELHFQVTDPLGTRRLQTDANGTPETACQSLPYGDSQICNPVANAPATADDATPLHFTGKERDSESGNDYFGARYYGSSFGLFISPDDGSDQDPEDPQSWNLYTYVRNNPLVDIDPDGHLCQHSTFTQTDENGKQVNLGVMTDDSDCPRYGALSDLMQRGLQAASSAAQSVSNAAQLAVQYAQTTNWNCVGRFTGGGMSAGATAATATSLAALATGPGDLAIAPAAYIGETGWGTAAGFASGLGSCGGSFMMSSGSGGSGSGGGGSLSPKAKSKLGNLANRAGEKVRDVIRSRGGSGANVREVGEWADRTLGEAAQAAANDDPNAEKAIKIAKDAARLGQKY